MKKFAWGKPIEHLEIGPYSMLSYHPWKRKGCNVLTGNPDMDIISYHGYIDGEDQHEAWPSLESCLAGLMGLKYAGNNNGGVGYYFCKMIDAPPYAKE